MLMANIPNSPKLSSSHSVTAKPKSTLHLATTVLGASSHSATTALCASSHSALAAAKLAFVKSCRDGYFMSSASMPPPLTSLPDHDYSMSAFLCSLSPTHVSGCSDGNSIMRASTTTSPAVTFAKNCEDDPLPLNQYPVHECPQPAEAQTVLSSSAIEDLSELDEEDICCSVMSLKLKPRKTLCCSVMSSS